MNFNEKKEQILNRLNSDEMTGLTDAQVADALQKHGFNELNAEKKDSLFKKFFDQFKDPLILILIAAAVISVVADPSEWVDSIIIAVVVVFNAVLGVVQENNAEKSLEALKKMSAPSAKVIRNGQKRVIPSREVTVGDLVLLEAGDCVPSDGRILESYNLQVDESALTGESVPVTKFSEVINKEEISLGDQKNMVFSGTICTYGRGKMIVTSVGMNNEVGKIAKMLQNSEKEITPLQQKLNQISKIIGILCLGICVIVFGLEMLSGMRVLDAFKTAVALAVAAIPEGLATVVTIVLAMGVSRMVKSNAIVRKLPAVETLGSASVICSDKTGTLTQNKMTVVKTYTDKTGILDFEGNHPDEVKEMMRCFTLCCDGELIVKDNDVKLIGDPTETALVYASYQMGDRKEDLLKSVKHLDEIAFDSERKMMTVFYQVDNRILQITKGAPDVVLSLSSNATKEAAEANGNMANDALRVLAVAVRWWENLPEVISDTCERDLTFVGLAGMIDPPRLEVKAAIEQAKIGGIRTVMITGDHIITAKAIAKSLGILEEGQLAISGLELNQLSDEELQNQIENISVYARVAPEHKVRIVNAWQKKGHVVAMTGDGVNDSPALKASDIGCAMGITGTDVAKNAADMVLTDDNFATIVRAVKEGRSIYSNIRKDVQFLLSSNIGEVLTIFLASLLNLIPQFNLGVPLLPIHLLWVNLITDSLPAFALGVEPVDEEIMKQKPRSKEESFFAHGLGYSIAWQGTMIGMVTLASYLIGNAQSHEIGMTMAFLTLSMAQLFHAFNVKSEKSLFQAHLFNNKVLWGAFGIGFVIQMIVMYTPGLHQIFKLESLPLLNMAIALGLAFCVIPIVELVKIIKMMTK